MSKKCERKWWLGPLIMTLVVALCFYSLFFQRHQLPNWILVICGIAGFGIGACLPMIWAASTGFNPYMNQTHCRRHAYWYDSRTRCWYCKNT